MKRKYVFGIIALILLSALLIISCDLFSEEDDNPFKGTWVGSDGTAYFDESSWTINVYMGGVGLKGTYSYDGNTATITYTQISDNGGVTWHPITSSEASRYTRTATVSGNTLTWGISTYTRR